MRIYFASDLHGSEVCFRKFCAAADFYGADVLIMGGDVTGKVLVPIVVGNGTARLELGGESLELSASALESETQRIANMGYYAVVVSDDEREQLRDGDAYEDRLLREAVERIRRWVDYADERLGPAGRKIFFAPGNDDDPAVDEAFAGSEVFVNAESRVLDIDGWELATTGWSNPTPWKTPRECGEDELAERLRQTVADVRDPARAVFNIHVPPHGTTLDVCPELDEDLRVVTVMGNPVQIHAGSTAVRELIEQMQPPVSLHGHIHESRSAAKIGRTVALNPGSEYAEGILRGVIVNLDKKKVKYSFSAG